MKFVAVCQSGLGTSFMVEMNIQNALQELKVNLADFSVDHTDSGSVSEEMADYFFAEKTLVPALMSLSEDKIVALDSIIDADEIKEKVIDVLDKNGISHN
ncbi:PTS sugar transporter subunit IIB [Streptococcus chenjunshii]|uniref:PTS sugar transporter subunit IIB n=1 Tax=Streptococcus chenjunshii TaxID=2173853 RepID=A0A372KJ75_9STRE|nr:PTS sugar transporter subunit IIB [Streptococcus chenjunshii]AXQ79263.1 PTS sugar transporter subunit IIB [Streptococcus chenjunshii]RFU50556.1 PTS sugar transporter subunit IIB [Streptococcus chenjunshii]RFU52317.1 PTS sugar transporter subunit IIB [Streptococcus chenjunshii]